MTISHKKQPYSPQASSTSNSSKGNVAYSPMGMRRQYGSSKNAPPLSPAILSQESTDYSLDDTTAVGSLIGAQYVGDASVFTAATSESRTFTTTSNAISASASDRVPTDEELFAVGWAKAFDKNSGAYYYFTLDRKTIVWDNPIGE